MATRTGGSIYDRRIVEGLRALGWEVTVVEIDPVVHPLQPPVQTAGAALGAIADHTRVLIDGLAFGPVPELAEQHGRRLRFVPIVHMPLSVTPGLLPGEAGWLASLESRALAQARAVVITGRRTLPMLEAMGVRPEYVHLIQPGAWGVPRSPQDRAAGTHHASVRLLCVANVTPGKGHDVLLRALARVRGGEWTLVCAGSLTRDVAWAGRIGLMADELGLADRLHLAGELDDEALAAEYARADLFVLPTRAETYGMAVAEAIAHGVPVVGTTTGEIPAIVGEGGLLADADDEATFTTHLAAAIESAPVRERLGRGARDAATRLSSWTAAAARMAELLESLE